MMSAADWVGYALTLAVFLPVAWSVLRARARTRYRRCYRAHSYDLTVTLHEEAPDE